MKGKRIGIFAGCLFLVLVLGITPTWAKGKFLTITSGPMGGGWYILGGTLSELIKNEIPDIKVTVTTGGSLANLTKVNQEKADIGLTMDRLFYEARKGIGAYKDQKPYEKIVGMAYLADIYMSLFLVREDSPISSIQEIKEKKIPIRLLTSPKASSPALATERMLNEYGITFDDIRSWGGKVNFVSYAEASSLIKDGHADAWCGPMVSSIVELTVSRRMKLLPIKESVLNALQEDFKYGKAVIPQNTWYFIKKDTPIMCEAVILVVRKEIPEGIVYKITKSICTHPDHIRGVSRTYRVFSPEKASRITGGPIHPGALRYYKEHGYL